LAKELSKIEGLSAIFVPTSSGATAQGLAMGFKQTGIIPELHVIQTPNCHPIVDVIYLKKGKKPASDSSEISLAQAIVDQVGHRKDLVAEAVIESNGEGWIVTNQEITQTIELVKQTINISISPTSALSIAALTQAIQNNHAFQGPVVCLITGN
jgi:threonine synthase